MRNTGIHIIGDAPWGTHFCQFYQDRQDLIDVLVPYFKAGLENNEFCMWVTSEPLRAQEARDALVKEVPKLEDYIRNGQIEILDYSQWYTAGGGFESDRVLQGWVSKLEAALKRGFDGLRLTGNTFWLEKSDWRDFTDYEAAVNDVIGRYRMLAICTYSLARCGAIEIMDVVANHAFALIKRAGEWQVIQNSERKRAVASLRESEERYSSLFEQMTEGFALHEIICGENGAPCDYRFLEINPAFERLTGLKRADVAGKTMREVLPNDDPKWIEIYGAVALTGVPARFDNYSTELKRHYSVLAYRPAPRRFAVLFTDITERKRAEEAVGRESEARYLSLFNSIDAGFCIIEVKFDEAQHPLDYRFIEVNPAFERQTGLVNAAGQWMRSLAPAHEQHWFDIYGAVALTGEPVRFENQAAALNRWYEVHAFRVGEPGARRVAILFHDISERKRTEAALRESEERYRRLFAGMSEGFGMGEVIYGHNGSPADYRFIDVNDAFERQTGLTRDMLGRPMREALPNLKAAWQDTFRDFVPSGEPVQLENYNPETNRRHSLFCYSPAGGRFEIVLTDVTERKRTEERQHARSLIEASLDPLVTISPDGRITDVNEATELVTGAPRDRLIGSDFSDYFTEPDRARAGYRKVLSEGLVRDYPLTIRHSDGPTTDVLYNAVLYRNEAGQVQGVFAAARDVTERKRAEAELARYREHLEELVRQRTGELETANAHLQRATAELARSNQELEQFAYVASHDLQEPLRAVTGYLGLIEQQLGDKLEDKVRHQVAGAIQGASRMHTLITDLLALSRVGTRGQALAPTDLNAVVDQALESLHASVQEAGAKITRDRLPTLRVDGGQIVQLFQNLIGNALKFRGERPPEAHVSAQQKPDQWVFAVRDNGIGIEPQYFERIFLVFQRLHTRRHYPGTGIGLAICKKIVERHGGTIWVESQPGQGSTFCFSIPNREMP